MSGCRHPIALWECNYILYELRVMDFSSDGIHWMCKRIRMIPSFLFNDKRCTAVVIMVWLVLLIVIFFSLGVLHSNFFRFGPSPSLHFMTIAIDTPEEWTMLAVYCCVDTLVKTFGHDSIVPWLTHTLADPKCRTIPYRRSTCLAVMEVYFAYVHISGMFKFFLSLAQFDFVLINMLSDMSMKIYSYSSYMESKAYIAPVASTSDPDSQALMMLPVDEDGKVMQKRCDGANEF